MQILKKYASPRAGIKSWTKQLIFPQIRKGRLAQLQQQQGGASGGGSGGEEQKQYFTSPVCQSFILTHNRRQQENEARTSILSQVLTPEAADRLGRIRLVKESRATDVENRLIMLARSGQLRSKVTEDQLKELLGAMAENEEKSGSGGGGRIVVNRRKGWDDDDDDLLNL